MKNRISVLLGICCVITITGLPVICQSKVADKKADGLIISSSFSRITKEEIEMLMADVVKNNPKLLTLFAEDLEMKRMQLDNLKQLLAFASQAEKDGLNNVRANRQELENIRAEVIAVNYDTEINKNKEPMPPFGFITEDLVNKFWSQIGTDHEGEFQRFLDSKLVMLKQNNPQMKDRVITEEEKAQAREFFAKTKIYQKEFDNSVVSGAFPIQIKRKIDLQVKLAQAQFLARIYSEKIAESTKLTDADIASYIKEHPEFDTTAKKTKAEEILKLAKAGENFASLANKFTEDPGNKSPEGKAQGGIYRDVRKGTMVAPFEQAAIALEPGKIAPNLVETDFGYHIIKLERKGEVKDSAGVPLLTYDVRHILFSTTYNDPAASDGPSVPVKTYVRTRLETEKEKRLLDKIVADNNIQVPEDFIIPEALAEKPKASRKSPIKKKRVARKRS